MNFEKYIKELETNQFDFDLRSNLIFNQSEYEKLITLLNELKLEIYKLKSELNGCIFLPIDLALHFYHIPYIVRNTLDYLKTAQPNSQLTENVENAWIEIDDLVLGCLSVNHYQI